MKSIKNKSFEEFDAEKYLVETLNAEINIEIEKQLIKELGLIYTNITYLQKILNEFDY